MSDALAYAPEQMAPPMGDDLQPEPLAAYQPQPKPDKLARFITSPNIAEDLDDTDLARIGQQVVEEFKVDEVSRETEGWQERQTAALKLAMQVKEAKDYPWQGAANVKYPLIAVAAIQFAARAGPAIIDGTNVAKGKVLGKPTPEKQAKADRIARHLSYQLLDEMEEWEEETDQLLHILPCTGTVFRKTWFDPQKGRNCSEMITADKLVVHYWAKADAPRITQVCQFYPYEITAKIRAGVWMEQELGLPPEAANDEQAPHKFLEQHRLLDLDEDGYPEPYIVTVHKDTTKVVRIVARYDEKGIERNAKGEVSCIEPVRYFTRYIFMPSLDGSYYGVGFGTLLNAMNETINSTINQLLDAGHLSNLQAGFIGNGVSIKSGSNRFKPGEWKKAEVAGGNLRENIVPLPTAPPSSVLFELLGMLIEAAKDITATKDILTGDTASANQPVGTTLAQIEQGLKVFSAITKRVHRALKHELQKLFRLNSIYLDDEAYFNFQDEDGVVARDDYDAKSVDVEPVSDPNMVTDAQRLGQAQFMMQFRPDPLVNGQELLRRVFEAARFPDVKGLFAPPPQGLPPEVVMKGKELEISERGMEVKEKLADADLALKGAQAQQVMLETMLAAPQFQEMVAQFIDQRAAQIVGDHVRQGNVPGVGGQPPDQGVPGLPAGQPGPPQGPMGGGPGNGPPLPDQGPPDGGIGQPQLG